MTTETSEEPVIGPGMALRNCRYGTMLYPANDQYIGRSLELYGEYSPVEVEFFAYVLRPGDAVIDAGANIGALTLAFSRLVGEGGSVLAFEPQRLMYYVLCANLAINAIENVAAAQVALGAAPGFIRVPVLRPREHLNFGGLTIGGEFGETARVRTIDSMPVKNLRLIKIDVEGAELEVIKGAEQTIRRLRPFLLVENDRADKSAALIEALFQLDYRLWWYFTPLYRPRNFRGNAENVFGQTGSWNMVGVPREMDFPVEGREITDATTWLPAQFGNSPGSSTT
jgi:FkbM family methyltransferase